MTCTPNPARLSTDLSLASLTNKAISLLDKSGDHGFFLQVEGAANALLQALESSAGEERGALAGYRAPGARGADLAGPPFGLEFADAVLAWANGWRVLPPGA